MMNIIENHAVIIGDDGTVAPEGSTKLTLSAEQMAEAVAEYLVAHGLVPSEPRLAVRLDWYAFPPDPHIDIHIWPKEGDSK